MSVASKILEKAEICFFGAMLKGWASGAKGVAVPGMPKYKEIMYEAGDFYIVDQYGVSQAGKSEGTTRIWFCDDPVWVMSYGGFYRKEEIPFLKQVLMESYRNDRFNGGRGPSLIASSTTGSMTYVNWVNGGSSFEKFGGREEIRLSRGAHEPLGWHDYWGMALI